MSAPVLWLNIEYADGTETGFYESSKYRSLKEATRWAEHRCSITGCPVSVMQGGTVRVRIESAGSPDQRGYCPTRITQAVVDRRKSA